MTADVKRTGGIHFIFLCFEWYRAHHGHLEEIGQLIHDICIYIQWRYEFKRFLH